MQIMTPFTTSANSPFFLFLPAKEQKKAFSGDKINMSRIMEKFHPLLDPQSIAFVGASNSPGKWGNIVFRNIINGG